MLYYSFLLLPGCFSRGMCVNHPLICGEIHFLTSCNNSVRTCCSLSCSFLWCWMFYKIHLVCPLLSTLRSPDPSTDLLAEWGRSCRSSDFALSCRTMRFLHLLPLSHPDFFCVFHSPRNYVFQRLPLQVVHILKTPLPCSPSPRPPGTF